MAVSVGARAQPSKLPPRRSEAVETSQPRFFLGGIAVFQNGRRIGAVGVSGLPGEIDEQLALAAIERTTAAT